MRLFFLNDQAATDAKPRPGFQSRTRGNGISEIERKRAGRMISFALSVWRRIAIEEISERT